MRTLIAAVLATVLAPMPARAQRAGEGSVPLRIALAKQPFSPTGTSPGPTAMASGGIQQALAQLGAVIRVDEAALTPDEDRVRDAAGDRRRRAVDRGAEPHDRRRGPRREGPPGPREPPVAALIVSCSGRALKLALGAG